MAATATEATVTEAMATEALVVETEALAAVDTEVEDIPQVVTGTTGTFANQPLNGNIYK